MLSREADWAALFPPVSEGFFETADDKCYGIYVSSAALFEQHTQGTFGPGRSTVQRNKHAEWNCHFHQHHLLHCVYYLRQTVLCASDETLEPYTEQIGVNVTHECRANWRDLYRLSDQSSASSVRKL